MGLCAKFRALLRRRFKHHMGVRWGESSKQLELRLAASTKKAAHAFTAREMQDVVDNLGDPSWLDKEAMDFSYTIGRWQRAGPCARIQCQRKSGQKAAS